MTKSVPINAFFHQNMKGKTGNEYCMAKTSAEERESHVQYIRGGVHSHLLFSTQSYVVRKHDKLIGENTPGGNKVISTKLHKGGCYT